MFAITSAVKGGIRCFEKQKKTTKGDGLFERKNTNS